MQIILEYLMTQLNMFIIGALNSIAPTFWILNQDFILTFFLFLDVCDDWQIQLQHGDLLDFLPKTLSKRVQSKTVVTVIKVEEVLLVTMCLMCSIDNCEWQHNQRVPGGFLYIKALWKTVFETEIKLFFKT